MMTSKRCVIRGVGSYLPTDAWSNDDLIQRKNLDSSNQWIIERTGILSRHIAAENECTSDLAVKASQKALEDAGLLPEDIDLIIVATTTPDLTFPATATIVQRKLGLKTGAAFDVSAVCSGFIYALTTAELFITSGKAKRVLVIGAETMSRILDWSDRATCVLFGDGAGAVIVENGEDSPVKSAGIVASQLKSDGSLNDILYVDGGVSSTQTTGYLKMQGREVFRHAVTNLSELCKDLLNQSGKTADAIDWLIPHQANQRIMSAVGERVGLSAQKIISTVAHHGNTSAASVPLALDWALKQGHIQRGQWLMLEAIGGGMTWGGLVIQY